MARIIALSSRNNANNGTGGVTWPPGGSPVNISAPIKEPRRCFYATRPTTPCQNIRDIAQLLDDIRPTGKTCTTLSAFFLSSCSLVDHVEKSGAIENLAARRRRSFDLRYDL